MDGDSIWPPNFSQTLPDLGVGLFTGVVIGLILWGLQLAREERQARLTADAEWLRIRPQVLAFAEAAYSWPTDPQELPEGAVRLRDLLAQYPISSWRRLLGYQELYAAEQLSTDIARWEAKAIVYAQRQKQNGRELTMEEGIDFGLTQRSITKTAFSLQYNVDAANGRPPLVARSLPQRIREIAWLQRFLAYGRRNLPKK